MSDWNGIAEAEAERLHDWLWGRTEITEEDKREIERDALRYASACLAAKIEWDEEEEDVFWRFADGNAFDPVFALEKMAKEVGDE